MIQLQTPISAGQVDTLKAGDKIEIHGRVLCGRDAVLPQLVKLFRKQDPIITAINLEGAVIFHTAVSPAGIGPTTSNKVEIEESIPDLASAGVRIHIGKGSLGEVAVQALNAHRSIFCSYAPGISSFFPPNMLPKGYRL